MIKMRTPMAEVKTKQARALQLLSRGASYNEIAQRLGYANRGSAWRLVRNALRDDVTTEVEQYRAAEGARLNNIQAALLPLAMNHHIGATMAVLKVIDQRCQLNGLYPAQARGRGPAPRRRL